MGKSLNTWMLATIQSEQCEFGAVHLHTSTPPLNHPELHFTVVYFTILYSMILLCAVLYSITLYYTILHSIKLYCSMIYHVILYCNILYNTGILLVRRQRGLYNWFLCLFSVCSLCVRHLFSVTLFLILLQYNIWPSHCELQCM